MDDPGTGDVWMKQQVTADDGTKKTVWSEVGSKQNVDLLTTTLTHTKKKISLVSTFADLDPDSSVATNHFAFLKLGKGDYVGWGALYMSGQTKGWLVSAGHDLVLRRTTRIDCAVAVDWNFDEETLTSSFPASCIGKPTSFRYRTEIWAKDMGDGSHNKFVYYDFGNSDGHASTGFSDPVKTG